MSYLERTLLKKVLLKDNYIDISFRRYLDFKKTSTYDESYKLEILSRVNEFAYSAISNGIGSFKSMKAQAVVDNQLGQRITSPLYEKNCLAYWVAIAHIDFTDADNINVSHVERYSKSGSERSPELYVDGLFEMDRGVIEFK